MSFSYFIFSVFLSITLFSFSHSFFPPCHSTHLPLSILPSSFLTLMLITTYIFRIITFKQKLTLPKMSIQKKENNTKKATLRSRVLTNNCFYEYKSFIWISCLYMPRKKKNCFCRSYLSTQQNETILGLQMHTIYLLINKSLP